jgi:hypothetical protein
MYRLAMASQSYPVLGARSLSHVAVTSTLMIMYSPTLSLKMRPPAYVRGCTPRWMDFLVCMRCIFRFCFHCLFTVLYICLFAGQAYNYDDHNLTEEWMCSYEDNIANGPSDDEVIRTQLESLMDIMCAQVTDMVCNSTGVLKRESLQLEHNTHKPNLASSEYLDPSLRILKECPVWGIDSYTRRMIELSLEDGLPAVECKYSEPACRVFVEQVVLPTINSLPPDEAHSMKNVLSAIIYVSSSCCSLKFICMNSALYWFYRDRTAATWIAFMLLSYYKQWRNWARKSSAFIQKERVSSAITRMVFPLMSLSRSIWEKFIRRTGLFAWVHGLVVTGAGHSLRFCACLIDGVSESK